MYASSGTLAGGTADTAGAFLGRSRKMNPIQPEDVCKVIAAFVTLISTMWWINTTHRSNKNGVSIRMLTCWWYASMTLLMQLMRSKSCYPSILLLALLFLSNLFAAWHELCHGIFCPTPACCPRFFVRPIGLRVSSCATGARIIYFSHRILHTYESWCCGMVPV